MSCFRLKSTVSLNIFIATMITACCAVYPEPYFRCHF